MPRKPFIFIGAVVASIGVGLAGPAAGGVPAGADCTAQFVSDYHSLFPDSTIGELLGAPGTGAVHTDQPFGQELKPQATASKDACPVDLTP